MTPGLIIKNLNVNYGAKRIIEHCNIDQLPIGGVAILVGPNGSGKSTLLKGIAGLNKADGEIWLNSVNVLSLSYQEQAARIVYLSQTIPSGVHLSVLESIMVAHNATNIPTKQRINNAYNILNRLGIAHLALCYLNELSGGQKQLVGLAQSLIRTPSLLLLDEPLSALDLNYQFQVMELIKHETKERDLVTIIVMHDLNIALRYADHLIVLQEGKIYANGSVEQVITAELLANVYGVFGRVEKCSLGYLQAIVDGLLEVNVA